MFIFVNCYMLSISSPYLFVFVDDRVICYMGADNVAGGSSEA